MSIRLSFLQLSTIAIATRSAECALVNSMEEADVADSDLLWQIICSIKRQLPFDAPELRFSTTAAHSGTFSLRSVFVGHVLESWSDV